MINEAIYAAARAHLGVKEWPGAQHNPAIRQFAQDAGIPWIVDDETPWCATFVGAILGQVGLPNTGAANARSYLKWGEKIDIEDAQPGDVLVFWRGSRDGWQGHVGFFAGWDGPNPMVLGGNQGNEVSIKTYQMDRLLEVRRAKQPRSTPAKSSTVQASTVTAIAGGAGTAIATLSDLPPTTQYILAAGGALVLLLGLYILRERLQAWAGKGNR